MPEFSIGSAIGAGFRLITERPLTVLAWGFLYMLVAVVPSMLLVAAFFPSMAAFSSGGTPNLAAMSTMNSLQPLTWLGSLVANALVFCAIYRAVLKPQDDRGFYLRFGPAELWQGLLQVIVGFAIFALVLVAAIPLGILLGIGFVAAAQSGGAGPGWTIGLIAFAVGLAFFGVLWWLALRFSLAGPMTFAAGQLRLMESWGMTRGHTLKLFGLSLLQIAMMLLLYLVMGIVLAVVFGLGAGAMFAAVGAGRLEDLFSGGVSPAVIVAFGLVGTVVGSVLYGVVMAVTVAPWAEVYRQLSGRAVDAETFA